MTNLGDSVASLPFIGPHFQKRLKKLKIKTINDLFLHAPSRYQDFSKLKRIRDLLVDEEVTIRATITSVANLRSKRGINMFIANISDNSGNVMAIWFNQPYLIGNFKKGSEYYFSGKVGFFSRKLALISPSYESVEKKDFFHTKRLVPIYPETAGISSKLLRKVIFLTIDNYLKFYTEIYPSKYLDKYDLRQLSWSIKNIHIPNSLENALIARQRLAFDELVKLHLLSLSKKYKWQENKVYKRLILSEEKNQKFINSLPFELTLAQKKSIDEIVLDLKKDRPMNRLLQGDVGSGKTIIAALCAYICSYNKTQCVIMVPTQILAEQHYQTFSKIFKKFRASIALATSEKKIGDTNSSDIIIGTHSVLYKKVLFKNVSVIIVDEQHRFGVQERIKLLNKAAYKNSKPHILTMTATPIPRTIAMTAYGNMDMSVLDEMPKGRQKIISWIVPANKRAAAYKWVEKIMIKEKIQTYVVCPLIDESQNETMLQVKAAKTEYEKLIKTFQKHKLGLLHAKLKPVEKASVINKFKSGKIDILVSTPVVEVGIDIKNANIMIIEASERFGLSQLHQLRGRIGRGEKKAYCLFFTTTKSALAIKRLNALKKESSGFRISEIDLKLRGPGEIIGLSQHGFPELKIASWNDNQLISKAHKFAVELFENDRKCAQNILDKYLAN